MQDIKGENSTMGRSGRMPAPENDLDVQTMEAVISTLSPEVSNVDSGTDDSPNQPNTMNEDEWYFDAMKRVSFMLVRTEHSSKIKWHGLKLFLQVLKLQWKEISSNVPDNCLNILELSEKSTGARARALKRTAAALVAQVAWNCGVSLLKDLIPYLVSISAEGACEAELVCLVLRSISNIGITSATHVKADKGETHLQGVTEFLPQILPLLCSLLDKHAQASCIEHSYQHVELANQHEYTVLAVLDASLAYMEWTPLCDPANLDIIQRCGSLLRSNIFSTHALQYLKSIWQSKRSIEYDVALSIMFPILMNVSEVHLSYIGPELHCLKELWPSLGYHTDVHDKAVDKLLELLASVLKTRQDSSTSHSDRLLTCSSTMSQFPDDISSTSVLEDTSKETSYLVEAHIALSEAFMFVASCSWIQNYTKILYSILLPLSKIWSQLEMYHLCDSRFRTSLHDITVFFVEELEIYQKEQPNHSSLKDFIPLILSMLLKLLEYVHSLRMEELEEVVESYCIMKGTTDEDAVLEYIRVWLSGIRKTGYKFIGICAYLDTAFNELLESTLVCGVLIKDIESMDFRNVAWIIEYMIIPLVKNCPPELWTEWIDSLLQPLCHYCDYTLHFSWCNILYNDEVHVNENVDDNCVSEEGKKLMDLFNLTREVSNLLAEVALPELNCKMTNEPSLIRYLLYHDGLSDSIRRLIRNIFGYWTDDDAKMKAVPFCQCLFRLATPTESDNLISCVKDDIIPSIIRCLALEPNLKSSSGNNIKSSSNMDSVLSLLCEDAYNCIQNQKLEGEGDEISAETFKSWLLKEIKVTQYQNTSLVDLEKFVWTWEIEEEFRAYLPTYTALLHAVDKFGDELKDGHFLYDAPCNLVNEFISNTDIDCSLDSCQWTLSSMLSRKKSSVYWKRQNEQMFKFYCKLIKFKPYIKCTGCDGNLQELIENNSDEWSSLPQFHRNSAYGFFCRMLELWEPQFHPLIREDHEDVLTEIAYQLTSGEYIEFLQPFQAVETDFLGHLQPYARNYIDEKNKKAGYYSAKEQAELHKKFDIQLASGAFDHYVRQGDFPMNITDDSCIVDLNSDLLKLSIERRTKLLNVQDQLSLYYRHMKSLVVSEQLRNSLQSIMTDLEAEGFFSVDDYSIEWRKGRFSEPVDKFQELVFPSLHLPKHYVIRGIMDFWQIVHMKDTSLEDAFEVVVGGACRRWMGNLNLLWMDMRYYKHDYYDTIQDPVKKVWKKLED